MRILLLSSMLSLGLASVAFADGPVDSNADAASFTATVQNAAGLVLRVPVNAAGEENTDAAEMRVHVTTDSVADMQASELVSVFESSTVSAESAPVVATDANGTVTDQSTWGWYGYRGWGWNRPYYYSYYRPSYYWGGYNYNWGYRYNYYYNNCNYYYYW